MRREGWRDIGIRDKMQIINGTVLVFAAVILYFIAFIVTLSIGYPVITAGTTMLGVALAFFGITVFIRNQMIEFETTIDNKLRQLEYIERKQKRTKQ